MFHGRLTDEKIFLVAGGTENYIAKRNHDRNSVTERICPLTDTIFDQLTFFCLYRACTQVI